MKYEIVRDLQSDFFGAKVVQHHLEQPKGGFLTAADALWWIEDRGLDGSWYIRPVEASNA